jgi:hypothetical protein
MEHYLNRHELACRREMIARATRTPVQSSARVALTALAILALYVLALATLLTVLGITLIG